MTPDPRLDPRPPSDVRAARSPRISLVAWIEDPQRDPGALLVRIAKVMVGLSARWEAIIVHDPQKVPIGTRLAPWLKAPGVRLVAMPLGTSAGAAVREALALADGDLAIVLDAPMQRCPECLGDVVQGWRDGADAVRLAPVGDALLSQWPSTALFRVWCAGEGLSAEWLGGLRLFSAGVLARLVPALESGVPEFTVWSVLTLPERVVRPWGTLPMSEPAPPPAFAPLRRAFRRVAENAAAAAFSVSTMLSGVAFGASRSLASHPVGRRVVIAGLLLSAALPFVLGEAGPVEPRRIALRCKPVQISGIGLPDQAAG